MIATSPPPAPSVGRPIAPSSEATPSRSPRDYLSYTAIRTYQRCPLRYHFQYELGLPPEFTPSSLAFGSAIHAAVEAHFRAGLEGLPPPSLETLLAAYENAWSALAVVPVRFGKTETITSLRELAIRMLTVFQQESSNPLLAGEVLAVEEEFRESLLDGVPDLLGRVDLVLRTPEALKIIDFKTSRSVWSAEKCREAAPQQWLYATLVQPLAAACGDLPVILEWWVLTKTKQPVLETHRLVPEGDALTRTLATVRQVWRAIQGGAVYPVPSAPDCVGCPHSAACRAWPDGMSNSSRGRETPSSLHAPPGRSPSGSGR